MSDSTGNKERQIPDSIEAVDSLVRSKELHNLKTGIQSPDAFTNKFLNAFKNPSELVPGILTTVRHIACRSGMDMDAHLQ
jgi:hypothetical protein